jgi:hypothetical protein
MKRRFTLLAIATFLSGTLMAAWDGSTKTAPTSGDGNSESTPYLIETEANLAWLANEVNNGTANASKFYKQTAELDLGNNPWTPIGNTPTGDNKKPFTGTYDGNGKVIKNLYINAPTADYKALFGGIDGATLKNITVASGFVYGKQYAAGICGFATGNSKITCCANIATVYGKQERNGGVVAYIEGKTKVNNCINYGLVSAFNYSGGVVGFCNKTTTEVANCINVGQVFGMRYTVGNCFGYNKDFGCPTTNCYYDNQINASEGWTRVNPIESDLDVADQMEGKPTSAMTSGNKLDNSFSNDNWVFTTGMYPRLKTNYEQPAVVLAATPVSLSSGDNADNVTKDFTVSTANSVSWVSGDTTNLTISGTSASILKNTGVILTASKEGYTKTVYLKTNKANATAIGSSSSPLTIETESELEEFREAVNNYGSYKGCAAYDGFKGIHFIVTVDIELADWTEPIGIHNSFKGIFDGNHRSIKGINVAQTSYSSVGGLFGCLSYGEIKNITVYGSVKGKELIGGICGATFNEHMTNCVSYCTINCSGKQQTGGIAGDDRGFSTFTNCENYGTITAGMRSGGILGRSQMGTTLDGCKNFGDVTGNDESIGGICGSVATTTGGGTIINCENHGKVKSTSDKGKVGGIIGSIPTNATEIVTTTNCINTGIVDGKYAGGIIGHAKNDITLSECLNMGTITGTTVGGIVGFNEDDLTITNAFNAGEIAGGAIVGSGSTTCTNCINIGKATSSTYSFYDSQLFSTTGGTGKKTSEMTGTALDLGSDWDYNTNMYPMIKTLSTSDYMIVAASAIILDGNDDINNVNKNFTYGTGEGVEWTCSNHDYISFANGTGYLTYYREEEAPETPASVTVTATKKVNDSEISKTIPLTLIPKVGKDSPGATLSLTSNEFVYGTQFTEDLMIKDVSTGCPGNWEYSIALNSKPHAGSHTLTATFIPSNDIYDIQTVSVDFTVNKKEPTIVWNPQDITYGDTNSDSKIKNAVAKDGDDVLTGIYTYNIPVLTPGEKIVTVTFSNTNYEITTISEEKNTQKTINVNTATPSITWADPAPIEYGTPLSALQLGAVSGVNGRFKYYIGNDEVNNGLVLPVNTYTLKAEFTPSSSNYGPASTTRTLVVNKAPATITWDEPANIKFGTELSETQLNASVKGINGATITGTTQYEPAAGTILNASEQPQTLRFTFTPTGDDANSYRVTTKEVEIFVEKATPEISWSNPANITYGTLLNSNDHLNASVVGTISGTYTYTPAAGTKLNAGDNQILRVDFVPNGSDANNYDPTYKEVRINVSKAKGTINWENPANITYGTLLSEDQLNASVSDVNGEYTYTPALGTKLNADENQVLTVVFTPTGADADNYLFEPKTVTINVDKATPKINWNNTDVITYGTPLTNATANVGGSFVYKEGTTEIPNQATLNVGNHTITVEFTPSDGENYNFISNNYTISVTSATANLTWTPVVTEITYGDPLSAVLNANTTTGDNGAIIYKEGETIVTSETILNVGSHNITAILPAAGNYNEATVNRTITVKKADPIISWTQPAPITYGTALNADDHLNASSEAPGTITYKEGGNNVKIGDILNVGEHTITATLPESDNYNEGTETAIIVVNAADPNLSWTPVVTEITYGTALSDAQLNAVTPTDGTITYKEGETVVTSGTILDAGDHTITATLPASGNYNESTSQAVIKVKKADPVISYEVTEDLSYGATATDIENSINASATFNNVTLDGDFSYSIPATLNAGSKTVTITFTPNNTNNFNVATIKANITINQASPVVTWDVPAEITITYGTVLTKTQLKATTNAIGQFSYLLAEGGNALDTIIDAGTYVVKAVFSGSINYAQWEDSRTVIVEQAVPAITWEPNAVAWGASAEEIDSNVKNAVAKDSKGNVLEGEFTYIIPELTAVGEAEVSVTFENKNYKSTSATTKTLNVTKANPVIAWTPQNITFGASVSEILSKIDNAQASYNGEEVKGAFEYDTNIPNLNAGTHVVTVKFTPQDGEKFNDVEETAELTIEKATPTIVWEPKNVTYGASSEEIAAALENAEAQFNGETVSGDYEYILPLTTDLQVGLEEMDLIAVVTFTPTGDDTTNFEAVSTIVNVVVEKATPVITWNTPEDITVGTALSAAQLNATANVEGDFVYTPAADAVLEVGEHQKLSVVFTPTDAVNYNSASDSVFINVKVASADTTQIDSTAAIVWAPSAIVYGTPVGETFNATAKVEGEITYSLAADSILNAGEYKVTAKLSPVNGNVTTIERIVKVAKAELTATAANDTIMQGDTMPKFEINYTGFVGNDNAASLTTAPTATCSASTDTVGSFEIVVSGGEAINYDFKHVNGLLTILAKGDTLPKPNDTTGVAIITWTPAVRIITYGTLIDSTILNATANVEGTFTYAARQEIMTVYDTTPGEIVYEYITRSLAIGDTLNVGKYDLIATFTPADSTIKAVNDTITLIVNEVNGSIISWAPAVSTITYGTLIDSTILNATAKVEGTFTYLAVKIEINEIVFTPEDAPTEPVFDTVYTTRSLAVGDTLNVGTYGLIATFVPADSTISAVNDTTALIVNKAVLKVSVADATIKQGDNMPSFNIDYEGFVLGENPANLKFAPNAKCDATTANAGTFDITLYGGLDDNYEFEYKNGKLTILKDEDVAINESAAIFEVYPNPSNGAFFVNAGDDAQEVRIFNSTGKLVKVENIEGVTRIDISEYANGMYFVKVGNQTKTIIKQ